jgi:hypothetical protein
MDLNDVDGLIANLVDAFRKAVLKGVKVRVDESGEVFVRSLHSRKLRVEFVFDSPEGALALGGKIAEAVALMRSATRRNNRYRRT